MAVGFLFLAASEPTLTATSTASGASVSGGPAVMVSEGPPRAFVMESRRTSETAAASVDELAVEEPLLPDPYPWPLGPIGLETLPREAADIAAGLYSEYLAHESYATRVLINKQGLERLLAVEAFPDERQALVERLRTQLDESLDPVLRDMALRSIRLDLLFPLGEAPAVIGITRVPEGFRVRVDVDGAQISVSIGDLGWKYARFWRER